MKDWAMLEILKTTHGASQALGTSSRGVDLGCPQTIRENGNYPHLLTFANNFPRVRDGQKQTSWTTIPVEFYIRLTP